jgi:hypothetical protein
MPQNEYEPPEFTDEQLRAALKRMGREARQLAFAAGRPIIILKGRSIVALHADGREEVLERLCPGTDANGEADEMEV